MTRTTSVAARGATSPRVLVVLGPGLDLEELQRVQQAGRWSVHDARSESPFACAEELVAKATELEPDLVVCLGSRTQTAEAIALARNVPLATTWTLSTARMSCLQAAWVDESELRRAAMRLRMDGCDRFATGHIEISGAELEIDGVTTTSAGWAPQRRPLRIGPRGIDSGTVVVHDAAAGQGESGHLRISAGGGYVALHGCRRRFQHLEVAVHPSPLRQLVTARSSKRRPVVDTAPL
jgi:hypothetical protein